MTICYIHDFTDRIASDFTIKEITGVVRLDNNDSQKIIYLRIKAFVPTIKAQIEEFEKKQVILLTGKFVANNGWYAIKITTIPFAFKF
ncbi:hypothetical protein Glove_416g10 [Diversispora epigaea]|uniref:Uncharacterized protein n=1 Tax=Diversispora epigaea TaxID=1348612 RepID=A0A397H4N9_9GLOM|nr:hypothetical protein Glove_416g11 [Diversispora epigaea]RHZ55370.1 hypothetical protein Glove_416g10 [Diversispora epigaea]